MRPLGETEDRNEITTLAPLAEEIMTLHHYQHLRVTSALELAIKKDKDKWTQADSIRVGRILNRLNWQVAGRGSTPGLRRVYRLQT